MPDFFIIFKRFSCKIVCIFKFICLLYPKSNKKTVDKQSLKNQKTKNQHGKEHVKWAVKRAYGLRLF